jgi:Spy/CpxP family protein refolding chaperone
MFRAVIAFLLMFVLPAGSLALPANDRSDAPQDHKWWQGQRAKELGLTGDQSARIERIYQAALPRLESAGEDVKQSQKELSRLVSADKTTEVDVVRQLNQVQAVRNELDRQWTLTLFRFYRELNPDQRLKVKAMFDARREQERRGGRRGEPPQRPPIKK